MRQVLLYSLIYIICCCGGVFAEPALLSQLPLSQQSPAPVIKPASAKPALSKREALRIEYYSHMGVTEATGKNDGYWVERFLNAVGLGKGNPWCAAFVKYCFDQVGVKTTITAWSPTSTPPARRIWQQGKVLKRLPTFGDVFSIYYPKMGRIGHTGFVDEWKENSPYVSTCEGNTNSQNSREGNGAFSRKRLKRQMYAVANWID